MRQSLYRIIDANFNRSREAARVMEEFARFVLNSRQLSERAKTLRHKLSSLIGSLEQAALLASRQSGSDVGFGIKISNQMTRKSAEDIFTAAAKRLPEALRTLSETIQTFDAEKSGELERLRFEAYELEKEIFCRLNVAELYKNVRLYVLVDNSVKDFTALLTQCIDGGADCIQLRCKGIDDGEKYKLALKLVEICKTAGVVSIINDSVDIAIASGADGVHLGTDDLPPQAAKAIYPRPMLTGVSTHNLSQLAQAVQAGADYVGIGPAFTTETKPGIEVAGIEYIEQALEYLKDTGIGYAAIGGINTDNINQLVAAGVKTAAVQSVVTKAADPKEVCRKIKDKLMETIV